MLNVNQAAKQLHMSVHTVRYYANEGLVPTLKRDQHHNRQFDQAALNWLLACHYLRQAGLSIKDLKHFIALCQQGPSTIKERQQLLEQAHQSAQDRLKAAQQQVHYIETQLAYYEQDVTTTNTDIFNPANWTDPNLVAHQIDQAIDEH